MGEASPDPLFEDPTSTAGGDRVRPTPARPARPEEPRPAPTAPRSPAGGAPAKPPEKPASPDLGTLTEPGPSAAAGAAAAEAPERSFTARGTEWIARVTGHVSIGRAPHGSAPLMLLRFARSDGMGEPLELLVPGRDLSLLGEEELATLLGKARPFSAVKKPGIFSEIRTGKKADL